MSYLTLQDDNAALARYPKASITRALERLVALTLVMPFDHQGRAYVCQLDWQEFQKKKYAKETNRPKPPADVIAQMTPCTQHLLRFHPGKCIIPMFVGHSESDSQNHSKNGSKNPSEIISHSRETLPLTQPQPPTQTQPQRPPLDEAWEQFKAAYPPNRAYADFMAQQAFLGHCEVVGLPAILEGLERHKRACKDFRYFPKIEKFLRERWWETNPEAVQAVPTMSKATASAMDALKRPVRYDP